MKKSRFEDLILFENNDFLAINKPPGISTLEDRSSENNIINMARAQLPQITACHRIDKDTSGALILARNQEAYRHLSIQFQNRSIKKIYHAVVHGRPDFDNFMVEVPLTIKNQGPVKWDTKLGKPSKTIFRTLEKYKSCSLVECQPITGRRHQIRVHLKYSKHPIIGDSMYGGQFMYLSQLKRRYKQHQRPEKPLINRMALHAFSLTFQMLNGSTHFVEAGYPKDYKILLKLLRKYGSTY